MFLFRMRIIFVFLFCLLWVKSVVANDIKVNDVYICFSDLNFGVGADYEPVFKEYAGGGDLVFKVTKDRISFAERGLLKGFDFIIDPKYVTDEEGSFGNLIVARHPIHSMINLFYEDSLNLTFAMVGHGEIAGLLATCDPLTSDKN